MLDIFKGHGENVKTTRCRCLVLEVNNPSKVRARIHKVSYINLKLK